jgi:hypothetical protein
MYARRACGVTLALLCAVGLVVGEAAAQPRAQPPEWKDPAGPPTQMDVWLMRLVGRYRVEGIVQAGGADNNGLPEGGLGYSSGNRATFKTPCVNAPSLSTMTSTLVSR